jgi:hypothetical protein
MAEKLVVDIEFKTNVQKISKDLESVKESLDETNKNLEDIGKTGKNTEGALKKIGKGFKGVGLAMKTLGVGLVIEAFNFLKEIMMQNQTVIDGVAIATETMGVIFNQITSVVTDVFDAVSKSSEGFEGLQKVIGGLMTIAITPLKLSFFGITKAVQEGQLAWEQSFFGDGDPETIARLNEKLAETDANLKEVIDDAVDAGGQISENIGEAVTELGSIVTIATETATEGIKEISIEGAIATGTALADAKKNEELLETLRAKQQLQSQLEAEQQRQIRDDINATFEDRINANNELGKILEDQTAKEKAIVDEKVRIAKLELSTQEDSVELQTKYQQALLEQIDIDERIAGQKSEQLTNQASLEKELEDARKEVVLATMTDRQQELESLKQDYEAKLRLAEQSGMDIDAITEQYNKNVLDANQKFADEDLEVSTALAEEKRAQENAELDFTKNAIAQAGSLFAEGSAMAKASGIAQATISTYQAMAGALAEPPFTAKNFITSALALATGLKSVHAIMKVKTEKSVSSGGGAGGVNVPRGGEGGAGSIGDLGDLSSIPSLTEQFTENFTADTPVQAYVVEQNVTNSQQINTMIQQKATL